MTFDAWLDACMLFLPDILTSCKAMQWLVGIAGVQYTVLTSIRHLETKGDVFLVTVADHRRLTSAAVTRVIHQLAESGLVDKTEDLSD